MAPYSSGASYPSPREKSAAARGRRRWDPEEAAQEDEPARSDDDEDSHVDMDMRDSGGGIPLSVLIDSLRGSSANAMSPQRLR